MGRERSVSGERVCVGQERGLSRGERDRGVSEAREREREEGVSGVRERDVNGASEREGE